MKRWHEEFPKTYREWNKHHREHVVQNRTIGRDPNQVDCVCDEQKGVFAREKVGTVENLDARDFVTGTSFLKDKRLFKNCFLNVG